MTSAYLNEIATLIKSINYLDHVVSYNPRIESKGLYFAHAINFRELVHQQVKINMIKDYDYADSTHRKIKYYSYFDMYNPEFKEFVVKTAQKKLFKIVDDEMVLRHKYAKLFFKFLTKRIGMENNIKYIAGSMSNQCNLQEKTLHWLFDKDAELVDNFYISDVYKKTYREKQLTAFNDSIGDSLCFDIKEIISKLVLKDIDEESDTSSTISSDITSNHNSDSDVDSDASDDSRYYGLDNDYPHYD